MRQPTANMDAELSLKSSANWNTAKFPNLLRHLALFSTVVIYTAVGAWVFQKLEHPTEISKLKSLIEKVENQRVRIMRFSQMCFQEREKCAELLDDYETALSEACEGGVSLPLKSSSSSTSEVSSKWSFPESAFFALTVLTTIGYGNTAPKTFWGRLFCILFAFVGIPLTLSVIADMGIIMATALSVLHRKTKAFFPNENFLSPLSPHEVRWISAVAGILFLVLYLSAGAGIFMIWEEEWGFFEGFYFCFITMTTIGFGDLVPKSPNYMFLCTLYILVGLALTSTIIELVRRQYARSWKRIQALTGPLSEMLKRMGDVSGPPIDMKLFQNELKKMLAVVNVARKSENGKEWQEAIDCVLRDIALKSKETKIPQMGLQSERHNENFAELYSNTLVIFICQSASNREETSTRCRLYSECRL